MKTENIQLQSQTDVLGTVRTCIPDYLWSNAKDIIKKIV